MIVNPGKFQSIIIDKKTNSHANQVVSIHGKDVKTLSAVKLLGVHIDDQLKFNLHITNICRSAANQLNALTRLKHFLNFSAKKVLLGFSSVQVETLYNQCRI